MEKKEKWKKMVKINLSILVFCPTIYLATLRNLKTLALIEVEKSVTENLIGEKGKRTNKKMVNIRRLIFSYTMQQVIPNICTKFQNPRCSCSWEIFDTNFPMYYIGVRDGKSKNGKRKQKLISESWFSLPQYTWPLSRCIQNLKTLALIEAKKSVTEIFIGKKEKWTNNGNDKQEEADSLLNNTSYTQYLYQISK